MRPGRARALGCGCMLRRCSAVPRGVRRAGTLWSLGSVLLSIFALAGSARGASIVSPVAVHELLADVVIGPGGSTQDSDSSALSFDSVSASAAIAGTAGSAFASQFTTLGLEEISSFGSANASGVFLTSNPTDLFSGSSRFALSFTVDADVSYSIDALLTVSESRGAGFASVRLRESGGAVLFEQTLATTGEGSTTDFSGALQSGVVYEIEARASGNVSDDPVPREGLSGTAAAGYEIHFAIATIVVPEPGTAASVGTGLALLVLLGRRSRG